MTAVVSVLPDAKGYLSKNVSHGLSQTLSLISGGTSV